MNIHWPQKRGNNYLPWYTIARRLLFWPVLAIGKIIYCLGIVGGFGIDEAKRAWKE